MLDGLITGELEPIEAIGIIAIIADEAKRNQEEAASK